MTKNNVEDYKVIKMKLKLNQKCKICKQKSWCSRCGKKMLVEVIGEKILYDTSTGIPYKNHSHLWACPDVPEWAKHFWFSKAVYFILGSHDMHEDGYTSEFFQL